MRLARIARLTLVCGATCIAAAQAAEPTTQPAAAPVRLTDDGLVKHDPVFWPGRNELVYAVEQPSGRMKLVRLNLETGKSELMHPDEKVSDREIAFSADGKRYAYNSIIGTKGVSSEIRVVDLETGKSVVAPSKIPIKDYSHWPGLSPDGRRLIFSRNATELLSWEINFDKPPVAAAKSKDGAKNKTEELPRLLNDGFFTRFSPDGRRIALAAPREGHFDIYTVDASGNDAVRLTDHPAIDVHPAYSPDGKRIAFVSNRDGNNEIYVMRADGSEVRRVSNHPERDEDPAWHPNGRQLAAVAERDGSFDIYLMDVPD